MLKLGLFVILVPRAILKSFLYMLLPPLGIEQEKGACSSPLEVEREERRFEG